MADYADDVVTLLDTWPSNARPILMGWSMGGLVAMIAATRAPAAAVIGLAPSTPSRTVNQSLPLRSGQFDASEYGITTRDPAHQPAMPDLDHEERVIALSSLGNESRYARDERARGVIIESLPCRLLIVTGTADIQWPGSRYEGLHISAQNLSIEGASHWGLVLNRRALSALVPQVLDWVAHP
jgi:pimeloyl-ACP methyl ester carboxylesterase